MRQPWITAADALRERMSNPAQVTAADPQAEPPPYTVSFLAHLRLLVGVPFQYLVPDPAMLPNESIRFFHLDRSWTDRLVDGVFAVGKVGSREQAHHQAAAPTIRARLDDLEPAVRPAQRGLAPLPTPDQPPTGAEPPGISGLLLRSAVVAGWPHLEIRAYRDSVQLTLLRLERLSTSVLLALFAGAPDRIELEEPHHGVQFGVTRPAGGGNLVVEPRRTDGTVKTGLPFPVAFRPVDPSLRVVDVASLRRFLSYRRDQEDAELPVQNGSAAFAIEVLQPPWKEVFSDEPLASGPAAVTVTATAGPGRQAATTTTNGE